MVLGIPYQQTTEPNFPEILLIAINKYGVSLIDPRTKVSSDGEEQAGQAVLAAPLTSPCQRPSPLHPPPWPRLRLCLLFLCPAPHLLHQVALLEGLTPCYKSSER